MIIIEFDELIPDSTVADTNAPVEIVTTGDPPIIEVIARTGDTVIVTGGMGPPGAPGPAGSAPQAYTHLQDIPAATWFVTHTLGWNPNVTVIDSGGNQIVGEPTYLDTSALLITFTASFGGVAYLS